MRVYIFIDRLSMGKRRRTKDFIRRWMRWFLVNSIVFRAILRIAKVILRVLLFILGL